MNSRDALYTQINDLRRDLASISPKTSLYARIKAEIEALKALTGSQTTPMRQLKKPVQSRDRKTSTETTHPAHNERTMKGGEKYPTPPRFHLQPPTEHTTDLKEALR